MSRLGLSPLATVRLLEAHSVPSEGQQRRVRSGDVPRWERVAELGAGTADVRSGGGAGMCSPGVTAESVSVGHPSSTGPGARRPGRPVRPMAMGGLGAFVTVFHTLPSTAPLEIKNKCRWDSQTERGLLLVAHRGDFG